MTVFEKIKNMTVEEFNKFFLRKVCKNVPNQDLLKDINSCIAEIQKLDCEECPAGSFCSSVPNSADCNCTKILTMWLNSDASTNL